MSSVSSMLSLASSCAVVPYTNPPMNAATNALPPTSAAVRNEMSAKASVANCLEPACVQCRW